MLIVFALRERERKEGRKRIKRKSNRFFSKQNILLIELAALHFCFNDFLKYRTKNKIELEFKFKNRL